MFHGVNPAMGWLFAVALGLHRHSRTVVLTSLIPLTIGHALAIAATVLAVIALGAVTDRRAVQAGAGVLLIAWAIHRSLFGSRHRVRVGMQVGMIGLGIWSFLMATAHGAGLMLVPALIPLCLAESPGRELMASGSLAIAAAAVGVHTSAMLATTALVSLLVYEWFGLAFLRRGWINLDLLWTIALAVTGLILLTV
jgi:hypothetical protein